jgi:hypothetical protein
MGLGLGMKARAEESIEDAAELKPALFCERIAFDREMETAMTASTASAMAQPIPEKTTIRVLKEEAATFCLNRANTLANGVSGASGTSGGWGGSSIVMDAHLAGHGLAYGP